MSTFDDFMIAETSQKNQEIRRLQEELSSLRSEVDTLKGIVKELADSLTELHDMADEVVNIHYGEGTQTYAETMRLEAKVENAANVLEEYKRASQKDV